MKEYNKIETLFERDEKTKKLIIGKFRSPEIEFLKDNIWQFTEKVDGTNIRVFWDGHSVVFAGRTDKAEIPAHLMNKLDELFGGEINAQMFEQKFGETQVELFGEGYGIKIQNGGLYRDDVDFILFDVIISDNYQTRESVEDIAKYFNIDIVPILLEGTLLQGLDYVFNNRKSIVAKNGAEIEGLVGRPKLELQTRNGKRIIVKIKYKDFN
ncbi:MAG: RNA ligase family protein [Clostridia bacterium]|nr:RNA ligase family protein [Clostridia bacterium]